MDDADQNKDEEEKKEVETESDDDPGVDSYGRKLEALAVYEEEMPNKIGRGDEVDLTRKDPTLKQALIGIGWDLKVFESDPLDLDVSVFLLDRNDKTRVDEDFIFYNNRSGSDGAVQHHGDSRTGAGEGDDETIAIDLTALPFEVVKVVFVLSIYDFDLDTDHDFSLVKNVYFRMVNQVTELETLRYELDEDFGEDSAMIIGQLERIGSEWVFRAVGESVSGGLGTIATNYGIVVLQHVQT